MNRRHLFKTALGALGVSIASRAEGAPAPKALNPMRGVRHYFEPAMEAPRFHDGRWHQRAFAREVPIERHPGFLRWDESGDPVLKGCEGFNTP